ncbi:aspartate aminotransferase family protein [Bacillus benzoevorans]|uniref:Adenosylmethionine-8-amino-7-oxononanoate aminotransferase n=1 Tax=Bacillus benzoevorans TaxID=1456 RepID=A0A7X0HPK2_9BACI|nr:aspartate aminotransferase family protein [Bacillus benzoevorans]MBB6444574.1 adenosylmethionine-8-amino-7-oxononanoate aminotransferase [Bacillus benzoevorans]
MKGSKLIKPLLDEPYPVIDYGKGIFLYDTAGNEYLDASSGAVTANIGHGVKEIASAMKKQADKVSFVYRSQFTSEAAEMLAEKIAQLAGSSLNWSFFVNSGSEATETAMKIAIQYWQEKGVKTKYKVLSRWLSYHGITLGALSMSGHAARRARFVPLLDDFPAIHSPYCYRCPYHLSAPECGMVCAEELDTAIKRIGPEHIAAFIAEPVIGAAGAAISPPPDYYKKIKKICEENQILFIADEVMTGFGRTGKMLASEHWGVVPDIAALGKGMGAGYAPIAAALVSDHVMEPILAGSKVVMSGHTLSANPQSCAVSLAVIEYMEKNQLMQKASKTSGYLFTQLQKLQKKFAMIGDVRGKGLLIGLEFVRDRRTKEPFPRHDNVTAKAVKTAAQHGLLLYPAGAGTDGINGDAVIIAPPLTITNKEIDELMKRLTASFHDLTGLIQSGGTAGNG